MRRRYDSRAGLLCFAMLSLVSLGHAEEATNADLLVPQTTEELRQAIAKIMKESQVPGAAIILVSKDEVLWTAEIGLADRTTNREVTPETMFRAGSISKCFSALAVLKLQEEGKLRLDDRVGDLVGGIDFANAWEQSDPLRLVHLLEHTSGFNEFSPREFAASVRDISIHDALVFDSQSRKSRWRPGRFFSYSNANYELAGHIIERTSGQSFDHYMEDEILAPLNMRNASFRLTEAVGENLATGYSGDGMTEIPYEHMLGRVSGALNTTPGDLAHLVQLLLNRGTYQGVRLFKPASIDRMETPSTCVAARRGMRDGYGLGNYTTHFKGFRFHGHSGSRFNFMALYGYAPEHGVGYVFMLNAANRQAQERIEKLVLSYLTRNWVRTTPRSAALSDQQLQARSGYYEPQTPRIELDRFLDRLLGIKRVIADKGVLQVSGLASKQKSLLPTVEQGFFRGEEEPAATVAFVEEDGELFLVSSSIRDGNYRRIPAWWVWGQVAVALFCLVMMGSALLFTVVWVPRKLLGYMRGVHHLSVRVLPLFSVLCLLASYIVVATANYDRLGKPTAWSVGFFVMTWLFGVATVTGLAQTIRSHAWDVNRWVWRHAFLVSIANLVVLSYLAYWGIIGLRTWA